MLHACWDGKRRGAWVAATGTVQIRRCGEQERTEIDSDSGPRARCRRWCARAPRCVEQQHGDRVLAVGNASWQIESWLGYFPTLRRRRFCTAARAAACVAACAFACGAACAFVCAFACAYACAACRAVARAATSPADSLLESASSSLLLLTPPSPPLTAPVVRANSLSCELASRLRAVDQKSKVFLFISAVPGPACSPAPRA